MHEQAACILDADHEWSVLQVYTTQLGLAWIHMLSHRCSFSILFMLLCALISYTISTFSAILHELIPISFHNPHVNEWNVSLHVLDVPYIGPCRDRQYTILNIPVWGDSLVHTCPIIAICQGLHSSAPAPPWLSAIQSIGNWINSTLLMSSPLRSIPGVWQWDLVWNLVRVVDCEPGQRTVLTELKEAAIITLPASIDQQHRSNCKRIIIRISIHWST